MIDARLTPPQLEAIIQAIEGQAFEYDFTVGYERGVHVENTVDDYKQGLKAGADLLAYLRYLREAETRKSEKGEQDV